MIQIPEAAWNSWRVFYQSFGSRMTTPKDIWQISIKKYTCICDNYCEIDVFDKYASNKPKIIQMTDVLALYTALDSI